ncbi:hypothetical protein GCM10010151_51970 [Actinoallomurus spadix]|uniref:Uncharacterized protein n=1 Tax=Actinoallomurus spadix TaxID=79912 RepID=A0ABP3GW67_9ACTN
MEAGAPLCAAPPVTRRIRRPRGASPPAPDTRAAHTDGLAPVRAQPGRRAYPRARVNTASSIGSVTRPVKVFCWLGW